MKQNIFAVTVFAAAIWALGSVASAQPLYKWVDEHGNVHYGDRIPPEYANRDRSVLNDQAIAIGFEEGALDDAEIAERDRLAARDEAQRQADMEAKRRDEVLLATYLTIEDIETLRDSRLAILDSQIAVTEQYLAALNRERERLENEVAWRTKDSTTENPKEVPADLAAELTRTKASIALYQENIERTRNEQQRLRESFAADIERFAELLGNNR